MFRICGESPVIDISLSFLLIVELLLNIKVSVVAICAKINKRNMATLEEIRAKIEAARSNVQDKIEWATELKIILKDIIDLIESGQITFSNGLSGGMLGGELSESETAITFPDATNRMMLMGTITDENNGGVLLELANQFENSDFHFSILSMLFTPDFLQGFFKVDAGGVVGQAISNNGGADMTVVSDSVTLAVTDYTTGAIAQFIINSSVINFVAVQAMFDAFLKAKAFHYTAYEDTITALANIPDEERTPGMTFYAQDPIDSVSAEWMFEGGILDINLVEKNSRYFRGKKFTGPVYADDAAAGAAGLSAGEIYQRTTGEIAVKL